MSRIGKQPVAIPDKVKVTVSDTGLVTVQGPKGSLTYQTPAQITVAVQGQQIVVTRQGDERAVRALHGLVRALLNNMVKGVQQPYEKSLEINGKGWRVEQKGKDLVLNVGFSHPVNIAAVPGIEFTVVDQTHFKLSGIDKQLVGDTAASIRRHRPPEPYKGFGIKYSDEHIRRKEGKKGV